MSFENTRIYKLLSSLDAVTMNRFAKFIHSPYFNVNEKITNLFDIIHNALKKGIAVQSKEELWNKVGFAVGYKDIKFRKLCNDLVERYERFLIVETLDQDEPLKSNLLIKAVRDKELDLLMEKQINKSSNVFDRTPERSSEYFLQKYTFEKHLQSLKSNYEKKEDILKYVNKEKYNELSLQLDSYYVIEKLRYAIDVVTWNKQYNTNIDLNQVELDHLIKQAKSNPSRAVEVYILLFEILTIEESSESYYKLKTLAKENIDIFSRKEQSEIFDALFSYCVKWVNKGNLEFHNEYLDLHEWGISEELILSKGLLSPISFRNYIVIGLRVNQIERIESYIEKNIILLDESIRNNALNFNLARVSWYKKKYDDVLSYLNQVLYNDVWYNLNARTLLLAAYYELDEIDPLYSQMDAFSSFLRREKSLNQRKHRYLNFISYLKRIVNSYGNNSKIQKIKEKLTDDNQVVNKPWLMEKIEDQLN